MKAVLQIQSRPASINRGAASNGSGAARGKPPAAPPRKKVPFPTGYPIHSSSLVSSVALHCVGIALLLFLPAGVRTPDRPIYEELIRPNERHIVFYKLREKTPDVVPLK